MSGLILPPGFKTPELEPMDKPEEGATDVQKAQTIPEPTGWRLLCVVPEVKETFNGSSIVKAETVMRAEELTSHVLYVLRVGPDAYKDAAKFPSGAWCKEGDFIICRAYAGTRFKVFGREFRLLNDDQVDGVVSDPRGIARAG